MSAFDWSPGGCCCTPPSGYFDFFYGNLTFGGVSPFQRFTTMPPLTQPPVGSLSRGWSIPSAIVLSSDTAVSSIGFTRDGTIVWNPTTTLSNNRAQWLEVFDCKVQSSLAVFTAYQLHRVQNGIGFPNAIGDYKAVYIGNTDGSSWPLIAVVDTAGFVDEWTVLSPPLDPHLGTFQANYPLTMPIDAGTQVTSGDTTAPGGYAVMVADLDWPTCLAVIGTGIAIGSGFGQSGRVGLTNTHLAVCSVDKPLSGSTFLHATNIRTISTATSIISFSSHNGFWAAISDAPQYSLIVNGGPVWSRTISPTPTRPLNVHVCYPHETLGAGYVAVGEATGSDYYLAIYKDGVQVWRSMSMDNVPTVYGSTDRWIYFTTAQTNIQQMTARNVVPITSSGPEYTSGNWIVRHDGSEILPAGIILDTFGMIHPWEPIIDRQAGIYARDSTLTLSLPGSYQEMYDGRNG